ncbi:MAG TPA: hypothetical protein PLO76_00930 [Elusimicrobiota bacterium]|nr:hypothetical protein [Elusimicrobiota bacterium]
MLLWLAFFALFMAIAFVFEAVGRGVVSRRPKNVGLFGRNVGRSCQGFTTPLAAGSDVVRLGVGGAHGGGFVVIRPQRRGA